MWLSLCVQVKFVQVNCYIYQLISPNIIAIFFWIDKDAAKKLVVSWALNLSNSHTAEPFVY